MSLLYRNNDVALPHAGLLSYFTQPRENDGCNESAQSSPTVSPSSSDVKHSAFDEEAQDEFWELDSTTDTDCEDFCQPARRRYHGLFHMLYDFWGFLCLVALSACAVLMGLDVALGQFGMDIGLTDCMLGRHLPPPPMVHEVFSSELQANDSASDLIALSSCISVLPRQIAKRLVHRRGIVCHQNRTMFARLNLSRFSLILPMHGSFVQMMESFSAMNNS